jgi:hypothetical protein
MSPADGAAAKIETAEGRSAGAAVGSNSKLSASHETKPLEDLHNLLLRLRLRAIDSLDGQAKAIEDQMKAIEGQTKAIKVQTKRRTSRVFLRYLVAICIGVAGTLAWQSHGEQAKQIIATRAPELGWSPEVRQMITSLVQQLGWMTPLATRPHTPPSSRAPATALMPDP